MRNTTWLIKFLRGHPQIAYFGVILKGRIQLLGQGKA